MMVRIAKAGAFVALVVWGFATSAHAVASCPATPAPSCKSAAKSQFLLKGNADQSKDKLTWKWLKGQATTVGELDSPTTTTNYALCLYAATVSATIALPAGSDWQAAGSTGYKFKDANGAPDGAQKASLKSGTAGKAKALVKGKGSNLPTNLFQALPLPLSVQLVNDADSTCFGAVYSSAKKNDASHFKAATQWYLGAQSASCDDVCTANGTTYSNLTQTFAGDQGTDSNCQAVFIALGIPGPLTNPSANCSGGGFGCVFQAGITTRCTDAPTTGSASYPGGQRACACR
jgi:hypothetical protein